MNDPAAAARVIIDILATGDLEAVSSAVAGEYIDHQGPGDVEIRGLHGFRRVVAAVHQSSDVRVTIEDLVAAEDKAALRLRWQGINRADERSPARRWSCCASRTAASSSTGERSSSAASARLAADAPNPSQSLVHMPSEPNGTQRSPAVRLGAGSRAGSCGYQAGRRTLIRMRSEVQVLPGPLPATTGGNAGRSYIRTGSVGRVPDDTSYYGGCQGV